MQKEIVRLEKEKRRWDDIYSQHSYYIRFEKSRDKSIEMSAHRTSEIAALAKVAGLSEFPTFEVAKAKVKELRAALKAAKLKLREVRQPNSMEAVS
jgi:hypothetical protein